MAPPGRGRPFVMFKAMMSAKFHLTHFLWVFVCVCFLFFVCSSIIHQRWKNVYRLFWGRAGLPHAL